MKDTFDKVVMDEEKQEEIRAALMGKKRAKKTWLAPLVAVAAAIAVIMIVPYTRAVVVRAAGEILRNITVIHNGRTLKYTEESEIVVDGETVRHFTLDYNVESGYSYAQVKDNRLYFVLDDKWTDITDVCGEDKYFRYEEKGDDGSKFILYIGGTVSDHGVMQVLLDVDGNCVSVISNNDVLPKWAEKALKDDKIEPNFVMTGTGGNFL